MIVTMHPFTRINPHHDRWTKVAMPCVLLLSLLVLISRAGRKAWYGRM